MTKQRIIRTAIFIAVLAVLAIIGWFIYRHIYSATIHIYVAPKSSGISINSDNGHSGDNYVKPGTYTVRITKQGFTSYTEEVTVKAGETVTVEAGLSTSSDATADWYDTHKDDYAIAQEIWDRKERQATAKMLRDYPLISVLPLIGPFESYRVDYGVSPEDSKKYIIIIRSQSEAAKRQALDAIDRAGYDISRYTVEYESNALSSGGTSLENTITLTDSGMPKGALTRLKTVLGQHYPNSTLALNDNTTHTMQEGSLTNTYTNKFTINNDSGHQLVVVVRDLETVEITVDGQMLYSGDI